METDRRNFAVRTYRVNQDSSSSDDDEDEKMSAAEYNYSEDDEEDLVEVSLSSKKSQQQQQQQNLYYSTTDRSSKSSKNKNKNKTHPQHPSSSSSSSKYVTARSGGRSKATATTATATPHHRHHKAQAQVPRVPNKADTTTLALTEAEAASASHRKSNNSLNKKEKLVDLLLKVARKEAAREDFNLSRRTKKLVEQMLDQDTPFLFYAHLIELVQRLSPQTTTTTTKDEDPSSVAKQMLVVLDSLSTSLLSKSEERQARKKPSSFYTFNLFGGSENSNGSEEGQQPNKNHLHFEARKIRALLALESLAHNCPENFASIFLQHQNIHAALAFIMSSCGGLGGGTAKSTSTSSKDTAKTNEALDLDQVQREAFHIARRMLNWSEYSRSASGALIRKWCKRQVDKLYLNQLRSLYDLQVSTSCSLCQMSKWEWLADVEQAAVTIQSHFRSYLVRREIARRKPYGKKGPFTSRVFPYYRRNAAAVGLEDTTTEVNEEWKSSGKVHPLDVLETRIQRRQTNSSISTVGESLMSQLPLEQVYLEERQANISNLEEGRQAMYSFIDRGMLSPLEKTSNHHRVTDSDYDSGTEYAASTRVTIRPRDYRRYSRQRRSQCGGPSSSSAEQMRSIQQGMEHVEYMTSPKRSLRLRQH
jgi:hypothetical protein